MQIETEGRAEGWTKARQNVGRGRAGQSRAEQSRGRTGLVDGSMGRADYRRHVTKEKKRSQVTVLLYTGQRVNFL